MSTWSTICAESELIPGTGVCALHQAQQVAIFKFESDNQLFAVSNFDPIAKANVLSRGLIGSLKGKRVVASPIYKQHFCLQSGECLEEEGYQLKTFKVRSEGGYIQLQSE